MCRRLAGLPRHTLRMAAAWRVGQGLTLGADWLVDGQHAAVFGHSGCSIDSSRCRATRSVRRAPRTAAPRLAAGMPRAPERREDALDFYHLPDRHAPTSCGA